MFIKTLILQEVLRCGEHSNRDLGSRPDEVGAIPDSTKDPLNACSVRIRKICGSVPPRGQLLAVYNGYCF